MSKKNYTYTNLQKDDEFAGIAKSKELVKYTIQITNSKKFPKKYRFTLVNRAMNLAFEIFELVSDANELNLKDNYEAGIRLGKQRSCLSKTKTLSFIIEISFEKQLINKDQYKEWTNRLMEVRRIVAGWYKSDKSRCLMLY